MSLEQSERNRTTWATRAAQRDLDRTGGYTDAGEKAALDLVKDEVKNRPILDIGVGTGRTIPILSAWSPEYVGIDFEPTMVEESRRRYPRARLETGDARELQGFPDGRFALAYFSYAGIDAVSPADRRRVFRAVHRVLAPRGYFVFSTLNLDGPSFRERPWRLRLWPTKNPVRIAWRVINQTLGAPLDLANWLRIRGATQIGDGFAVAPLSAHHYRVIAHFTTLRRQLDELAEEGFTTTGPVYESRKGNLVAPGDDASRSDWFTVVARRV